MPRYLTSLTKTDGHKCKNMKKLQKIFLNTSQLNEYLFLDLIIMTLYLILSLKKVVHKTHHFQYNKKCTLYKYVLGVPTFYNYAKNLNNQ